MLKIAVCDDEERSLKTIEKMLDEYDKVPVHAEFFYSGEEFLASKNQYDLVLLDIDLQGISGIETAEKLREKDRATKIIYITNYSEYTIFAFAVHAFAYLLKPLQKEDLYRQLDEALAYSAEEEEELEFVTREGRVVKKPGEILYFEYLNREVVMHMKKEEFHLKKRINDVAAVMEKYDFVAPHKSFVVNLYHVQSIHGYDLCLTDGTIVPLSQKKSAEFRRKLNCFLTKRRGGVL